MEQNENRFFPMSLTSLSPSRQRNKYGRIYEEVHRPSPYSAIFISVKRGRRWRQRLRKTRFSFGSTRRPVLSNVKLFSAFNMAAGWEWSAYISATFVNILQTFEKPGDLYLLTDRSAAQSLNTNERDQLVVGFEIWRSGVQVPLWPLAGFVRGSPWFNSSAALVHSQLVCHLPVGILRLLSLFELLAGPHQP